jgi:hypothetical protein
MPNDLTCEDRDVQRDMELVRKILFALEAKPVPDAIETVKIEGYDDLTVRYHLLLLAQAKLIDYEPAVTKTGRVIYVLAFNPSWQGYEFLDAVRDEAVWNRLKAQVSDKGASVPFDVLKLLAIELAKKMIGL